MVQEDFDNYNVYLNKIICALSKVQDYWTTPGENKISDIQEIVYFVFYTFVCYSRFTNIMLYYWFLLLVNVN